MLIDLLNPYAWVMRLRRTLYRRGLLHSFSVGIPVLSVGNLSSGGTGKTPFVIYLATGIEQQYRKRVAVVLRGYKRQSSGLLIVRDAKGVHASVSQSGDEAQLLSNELPNAIVICDEDRVRGAEKAKELGAEVVILDDGFQHLRIKRDLNILLINEAEGIPTVLPFGKGRETISAASDANIIAVTNSTSAYYPVKGKPTFYSKMKISSVEEITPQRRIRALSELNDKTVLAVSGIGNPESFENTIRPFVRGLVSMRYRDHSQYTAVSLEQIQSMAEQNKCDCIVTTSKDEVKLASIVKASNDVNIPIVVARSQMIVTQGEDVLQEAISKVLST